MKAVLSGIFGVLVLMTVLAMWMRPLEPDDGRLHLVWTSDPAPARQEQIRIFEELFPQYRLTLDYSNFDMQALLVQASSGVGPDIFEIYGPPATLQRLVEAGIAWDITEIAAEGGFGPEATWPAMESSIVYEGRQYAYPANVTVSIIIYNKNIFDDFGVPYPEDGMTWEEFFELAESVTRRTGRMGTQIFGTTAFGWSDFFFSLGGDFFSEDGTEILVDTELMRKAFQMHKDAIFVRRFMPSIFDIQAMGSQGGWGTGVINQFAAGRYATIVVGKWALMGFHRAYRDQERALERWEADPQARPEDRPRLLRLGAVRMPHFEGREPRYIVSGKSTAVNALSPNREAAVDFLRYEASEAHARLINETNDALPPNPAYHSVGIREQIPDLAELEMHEKTIASMPYGGQYRTSPFLFLSDVERVLVSQIHRIEANPNLEVEAVLATAQRDLEELMERNLRRDPNLREKFERRREARGQRAKVGGQGPEVRDQKSEVRRSEVGGEKSEVRGKLR